MLHGLLPEGKGTTTCPDAEGLISASVFLECLDVSSVKTKTLKKTQVRETTRLIRDLLRDVPHQMGWS